MPHKITSLQDLKQIKKAIEAAPSLKKNAPPSWRSERRQSQRRARTCSRAPSAPSSPPDKHLPGHKAQAGTSRAHGHVQQQRTNSRCCAKPSATSSTWKPAGHRRNAELPPARHGARRGAQAAPRRLEHPGPDRPARPAQRRCARSAGGLHQGRAQKRLALRARGARQGPGSPGKTPVLKGKVQSWLIQKEEVLAFVQARPADGGAGALVVTGTRASEAERGRRGDGRHPAAFD
jgi:hypothetical protein